MHRPALGRGDPGNAQCGVSIHHPGRRVTEAIAVPGLDHRHRGLNRPKKCVAGGRGAAVVRYQQKVGLQGGTTRQQGALLVPLDVTRQQGRPALCILHAQHATQGVGRGSGSGSIHPGQRARQQLTPEISDLRTQPVVASRLKLRRHHRQAVMGQDEPAHGAGKRRKPGKGLVAPGGRIKAIPQLRSFGVPAGIVLGSWVAQTRQPDFIGIVTQEVEVFRASVRDNLTVFGTLDVGDDAVREAIETVGLGEWFRSLDGGLDHHLEGDTELSAGEGQLLAFARLLLADPGLVILDEASSRLDPDTESRLIEATDRLLAGRTAIIIAHRLSTLDRVDQILVLDHGRVVEHGDRDALAAAPASRFHHLLATSRAAQQVVR